MRTKLVLGAALLAAGLASSMAQNVYSLNVVGYVNQTVAAGQWYMWGNPLSAGDNTTATIMTNLSLTGGTTAAWDGALVYGFSGGYTDPDLYIYAPSEGFVGWSPGTVNMKPGNGFFLYTPTAGTVTFVGEVQTTNVFNLAGPSAWSMVASAFPVSTNLMALGLTGQDGDQVYRFNNGYNNGALFINAPSEGFVGWSDEYGSPTNGPTLNVGEAVFYLNNNATVNWTQTFTIQ